MAKRKKTKLAERKLTMTFSIDGVTWAALDAVRNGRTRSYCIMEALGAWLKKENIALGGASTMMACTGCGKGVRPRYAVRGMCAECARALIAKLEASDA